MMNLHHNFPCLCLSMHTGCEFAQYRLNDAVQTQSRVVEDEVGRSPRHGQDRPMGVAGDHDRQH